MREGLERVHEIVEFHEGCDKPEFDGAKPTIRINGEDHQMMLDTLNALLAKHPEPAKHEAGE